MTLPLNEIICGDVLAVLKTLPDEAVRREPKTGRFIKGFSASPATQFQKGQHWRTPKPYWDKSWLENEYLIQNKTAKQIAGERECNENNILYFLKKHNIPAKKMTDIRRNKYWGLKGEQNGMYGRNGESNPRWRGGITPERQAFYSSIEWARVCSAVWKRDKAKCKRCGKIRKHSKAKFNIHHIVSFEVKALRAEISNLVLLCASCHRFVHSKKNTKRHYLREKTLEL